MKKKIIFLIILFLPCLGAFSQNTQTGGESLQFDMTGFPQWTRDLRRGEIVAFGSFPFAFFLTNFSFDGYRWASNGRDMRYAPWPLKPANAVEKSQREQFTSLGIAAGAAVTIALADHIVVRIKRVRQNRTNGDDHPETPLIIRRPLNEVIDAPYPDGTGADETDEINETGEAVPKSEE